MVAIFTYEFTTTVKKFNEAKCELYTLSNYETLIKSALESGYIKQNDLKHIEQWHEDPEKWNIKI